VKGITVWPDDITTTVGEEPEFAVHCAIIHTMNWKIIAAISNDTAMEQEM
jgi:hypothetical protein